MNSSFTVLVSLASSLASSLILLFAKSWQEKRERLKVWAREDRNRFHADRRAAYARFLVLARGVYSSTSAFARERHDKVEKFPLLDPEYEDNPLEKITLELREAYEDIQILATPAVREAAQRVNDCLPRIIDVVFSPEDCFRELRALDSKLMAATDEFRLAVRQELGINNY
jgi:hypothetical protein